MLPPRATPRAFARALHGAVVNDDYQWLRDRDDPAVLEYLAAENAYAEAATAHLEGLRRLIFSEIKSRVRETDLAAPARRGDWWYGRRTEEGPTIVTTKVDGKDDIFDTLRAFFRCGK